MIGRFFSALFVLVVGIFVILYIFADDLIQEKNIQEFSKKTQEKILDTITDEGNNTSKSLEEKANTMLDSVREVGIESVDAVGEGAQITGEGINKITDVIYNTLKNVEKSATDALTKKESK